MNRRDARENKILLEGDGSEHQEMVSFKKETTHIAMSWKQVYSNVDGLISAMIFKR